jgi:hypothetical protein
VSALTYHEAAEQAVAAEGRHRDVRWDSPAAVSTKQGLSKQGLQVTKINPHVQAPIANLYDTKSRCASLPQEAQAQDQGVGLHQRRFNHRKTADMYIQSSRSIA